MGSFQPTVLILTKCQCHFNFAIAQMFMARIGQEHSSFARLAFDLLD